jgi:uncharacterized hydrophobic protein (TIGR00271 family)
MSASSQAGGIFTQLGFDPEYLPTFEETLFIEGPRAARRLVNFFTLLLLATVIATYGILSNSTPTVIGAMIVAPLMGPMMATTAAVVMGSVPRALRALALTIVGSGCVILFAFVLAWVVPDVTISFTNNAEITSRIHPGLYALLTALAAGASGAFIMSRAEITDALAGVAIAISLVPPLCVVGISLQVRQLEAAAGALLLFLTNALAVLLAGGVVFLLVGLGQTVVSLETRRFRRRSFVLYLLGLLLVIIPLTVAAYQNVASAESNAKATAVVQTWLADTSYQVVSVGVKNEVAAVTVEGSGQLKPAQELANQLASALGQPVTVELRALPVVTAKSGD